MDKPNSLAREFDACAECRLEVGGPNKYRILDDEEILAVVNALEAVDQRRSINRGAYSDLAGSGGIIHSDR